MPDSHNYHIQVPESRKAEFERTIREFNSKESKPAEKKGPRSIDENCDYIENLTD